MDIPMRIIKQVLAALLVFSMLGLVGCGSSGQAPPSSEAPAPSEADQSSRQASVASEPEGRTLRIYAWNTEFQDRFNDYYAHRLPQDVKVDWVIIANEKNAYQSQLDADLQSGKPIDIFLVEADYALKYVNTDYTLDVIRDVGLSEEELAGQYPYTQEIATDPNGALKAVTWQATPGLFAYRRSIARDVLGTDDPAEVQMALSDWSRFNAVAEQAAAKGYKMLSGYEDSYRVFSNNVSAPWVDDDGYIVVDNNLMAWVRQTKEYTDRGYNNKTSLWSPEWSADQGPDGKVFGFFYSTWGINFTLLGNSLADPSGEKAVGNGIYGDYAVCEGPQSYYWGGTWICAAAGSENLDLVRDIMYTLTCDPQTMKQITLDTEDYTNNSEAMTALAESDYSSAFLGGQNHIALFASAASKIDMSNISPYDHGLTEEFQTTFKDYFDGLVDEDVALQHFYTAAIKRYPSLKAPQ